jgi:hypothetical protein
MHLRFDKLRCTQGRMNKPDAVRPKFHVKNSFLVIYWKLATGNWRLQLR